MHEMALAASIVEIVQEHAAANACTRVRAVHLSIGALSHVDPRSLDFGFEAAAKGTAAEGARLVIARPGGTAWCTDCSASIEVGAHGEPCPRCGGYKWMLTSGDEMRVVELEVE